MNIKINNFFNNLFLVLCLAVNVFAQNKVGLNYKNPNVKYIVDENRVVTNPNISKYFKIGGSLKYTSTGLFSAGALVCYGVGMYGNIEYSETSVNPILGLSLATYYAQQSLHAITYQQYVKIGKALLLDDNFQLDNLSDPERVIKVNKMMKNHPGSLFIKGGRLLKAGSIMNLASPLGCVIGAYGYQIRFPNSNVSISDYVGVASGAGAFTFLSVGTVFDFIGHAKIAKAGKILQNHTAFNVGMAGKYIKQSARLHNWIYGISLFTGAAMLGNAIFYYNYPTYYYPTETYYAIAITGLSLMFTFDIVSAAKLRKAGKLIRD